MQKADLPSDHDPSTTVRLAELVEDRPTPTLLQSTAPPQAAVLDPTTITRAKLGDIDAFTSIVEAYHQRCLRFARAMLRSPDDAEDMVQEAFVRLYRALPRYEERQRFESWLFQILGNVCRTANTVHHREVSRLVDDDAALDRVASNDEPGRSFEHEWGDEVRKALAQVPDYNREIFLLHYIEGFGYDEIERMTGIKQSALKMRVKRASDLLRSLLGKEAGR